MAKYKDYKNSRYEEMLLKKYNYNYGISEEKIAKFIVNSGSSSFQKNIIDYYGITYDNLLSTYIPELKNQLDGGYVFFLLYSFTEGGGAGNWINHYATNTTGNALQDLIADCDYLNSINVGDYSVCTSAPEVLNGTNYVEDKKGETQKTFNKMTKGTLGLMWMVSTMAGNSWVWATNWTYANQGSAPKCYFGNPYDIYIGKIIDLGGVFDDTENPTDSKPNKPDKPNSNNGGGTSNGGGDKTEIDNSKEDENDKSVIDKITDNLSNNTDKFFNEIKGKLTSYLYSNNLDGSEHTNKNFIVSKMYNNIVKIKETTFFSKFVQNNVKPNNDIEEDKDDEKNDDIGSGTNDNVSNVGGGGDDGDSNQTITEPDTETDTDNDKYKKPNLSGKYYINTAYGGLSQTITINSSNGSTLPNCTGYCWGRAYETMGRNPKLPVSNAYEWYDETDLPKGSTPKKGAIICYGGGSYGHVVFIEDIKSDGSLQCSQSDYFGNKPYGYSVYELDKTAQWFDSSLSVIGFIYPQEG